MDPQGSGELTPAEWLAKCMEPILDDREKELRHKFVVQYLIDENPVLAAMRCGFGQTFAIEYAQKWMQESYVQRCIAEARFNKPTTRAGERDEQENDKRLIRMALLREANYHGKDSTQAARVAALKALAQMNGMIGPDSPSGGRGGAGNKGGGVIEVPSMLTVDQWEKAAQASQGKLIADAST